MSTEANKGIAREFFAKFSESDIPGALEMMTEDATWWIPGKPELTPTAGLYQKDKITRLFYAMLKQLKSGLKMTPTGMAPKQQKLMLRQEIATE